MTCEIFLSFRLLFSCSVVLRFFVVVVVVCFTSLVIPMCISKHHTFICSSALKSNMKSPNSTLFLTMQKQQIFGFSCKLYGYVFSQVSSEPFNNTKYNHGITVMSSFTLGKNMACYCTVEKLLTRFIPRPPFLPHLD